MRKERSFYVVAWVIVAVLSVLLLLSVLLNAGFLAFAALSQKPAREDKPADEFPSLKERWSYGTGEVKIAHIAIHGVIMRDLEGRPWQLRGDKVATVLREIRAATVDPEIKGIILEVNSPGGDMTSSDEIYNALQNFKARDPSRQILSLATELAASGGYYVMLPSDHIMAEPTAVIGSIGVILQSLNWKVLAEKIGVTDTTIKSGENKDLLNPFREVSPEQRAMLQDLINRFHRRFFELVQNSRGIAPEKLTQIADGRIFDAQSALENELVDSLGYWEDALKKMAELLGQPSVRVIRYEHVPRLSEILANLRSPWPDLRAVNFTDSPRFLYLWQP